uniref:Putative dnaJ domain-containing protein n=1 Tax=Helianthus annuus TaxID=4232 RepID=A0A251VCU5_HELAN
MTTRADIHLIAYSNELVNGETVYTSSNYLQIKASHFEPVGHSFHDVALKLHGYYEEENVADDNENFPKDKETEYMQSSDSYSSKGKKKSGDKAAQQDHYALLGLGHLRYLATEDQIRKSYRETTIKHHPDKQAALLLGEETEAAKHCVYIF